jgi:hypothetical protein
MHAMPPGYLRYGGPRSFDFSNNCKLLLTAPTPSRARNNIKALGSPISRHTAVLSPGRESPGAKRLYRWLLFKAAFGGCLPKMDAARCHNGLVFLALSTSSSQLGGLDYILGGVYVERVSIAVSEGILIRYTGRRPVTQVFRNSC